MIVSKYHALGNDYLFLDAAKSQLPSMEYIRKICHRNFGIGSDGLLYGTRTGDRAFRLKIFNPDGGEAEISGNGSRIFAQAVFEKGYITERIPFVVQTGKKSVTACVLCSGQIEVDMGKPSFVDKNIPYFTEGFSDILVNGRTFKYFPVSMGNPHCVIFEDLSSDDVRYFGPKLEQNPFFTERTNVQFAKIADRDNIFIKIWERGAGYTLASGSSACAVFTVAKKLDLCSNNVEIHMPGGTLSLRADDEGGIVQIGPVEKIADCEVNLSAQPCPQLENF